MKAMAIIVFASVALLSTMAWAEVPGVMHFTGTLTDEYGVALDTTLAMTFSIHTDSTGGTQVWTEMQPAVEVSGGLFNVLLGRVNAIEDTVFKDAERWLGIQVGGDPEMSPRQRIASVGYAFVAGSAPGASDGDWTISGDDMYAAVSGNVGIGTMTPVTQLHVDGDATIEGRVGIGVPPGPDYALDVIGSVNAQIYQIAGDTVLSADGSGNIFLGHGAGQNITTGSDNTFLGQGAGHSTDTGLNNTFVGQNAGLSSTAGWYGTFLGQAAGRSNTVGWWNTFVGMSAGEYNTIGNGNTFVGANAGLNNTTGTGNTYMGEGAGLMCSTGSGNVFIGNLAGAEETGSNKLYIANGPDTSDVLIYGDFAAGKVGVGTTSPAKKLHVAGNATVDSTVEMNGFKMATDATTSHVLTSDASGVGSWQPTHLFDIHNEDATTIIGDTVTQYDDAQVSLTVPGPGYIIVTSMVTVKISHTTGTLDLLYLNHSESLASMGSNEARVNEDIPSSYPTNTDINRTFSIHSTHSVASAGTYTYYLVGQMGAGQDASDKFWFAQTTAVYYPSPAPLALDFGAEKADKKIE